MKLYTLIPYFQIESELISFINENDESFVEDKFEEYEISPYLACKAYLYLRNKTCEGFAVSTARYGYLNSEYKSNIEAKKVEIYESNKLGGPRYKIKIGLVVQLNYERTEALISSYENMVYRYSNSDKLSMEVGEMVIFCYDENDEERKITHCMPLSSFEIVDNNDNSYRCPNGFYCSEEKWFTYTKGIPFFSVSRGAGVWVNFPIQINSEKNVYIEGNIPYGDLFYRTIQRVMLLPRILKTDIQYEAEFLAGIRRYIESFDCKEVIGSYKITNSGYLQRRPGRDDHFIMTTTKSVRTKDPYILSLLPTGNEVDYYNTNSSEEDYCSVDEEQTAENISNALSDYNEDVHFAYLVSDFYNTFASVKDDLMEARMLLKDILGYKYITEKYGIIYPHQFRSIVEQNS